MSDEGFLILLLLIALFVSLVKEDRVIICEKGAIVANLQTRALEPYW